MTEIISDLTCKGGLGATAMPVLNAMFVRGRCAP